VSGERVLSINDSRMIMGHYDRNDLLLSDTNFVIRLINEKIGNREIDIGGTWICHHVHILSFDLSETLIDNGSHRLN
jgi:hypothetical protein